MQTPIHPINPPLAKLTRRLGAILYDSLLLMGVLLAASALVLLLAVWLQGAERVKIHNPLHSNPFFTGYLFVVCFLFYAWFWTHGGQTLGMRAWKIRIQQYDGRPITWGQAMLRFAIAGVWLLPLFYAREILGLSLQSSLCIGLGFFLLALAGRLHDRYSATVLVHVRT